MNLEPNYPSILLSWIALIGGLVLLTAGGEFLVSGAGKLAKRLGMSSLLIGLTVVAFGTSMPELFVGLIALFQDHPDILTGNVIGSNIANVGLILGICAIITPLPVRFKSVSRELYIVLAATLVVFIVAWHGSFPRFLGFVFVAFLIFFTVQSFRQEAKNKTSTRLEPDGDNTNELSALPGIILATIIGLGFLPLGSNFFIKGAVDIALHFGVSELVIGLTLAAVGTSLPELASCLAAIRQRQTKILTGNIIGSNLFNLLMVLGFCGLLAPFPMSSSLLSRDIPIMFSLSAVLLPILAVQQGLNRLHGFILLLSYICYLFIL
ncbi:MAG: calcium/sodium antiporter [Thermodesulfobacteriota bacterium]